MFFNFFGLEWRIGRKTKILTLLRIRILSGATSTIKVKL